MQFRSLLFTALFGTVGLGSSHSAALAQAPIAFVVAPSVSTQLEARRMLRVCRWTDTTLVRDADLVLVVVRSSGTYPMAPSYDSLKWLRDAANSQMNDSGAQFHVYLYSIRQDLSFLQLSHQSYDAGRIAALIPPSDASASPYPSGTLFPCG
ncbi:MAG TPA: hypothetical protein VGQ69_11915 [Gemmatimonadales bacterium]|jgi:hypothetical protein|nr:hypothetical protein [Gemmatimonadales bacterium]